MRTPKISVAVLGATGPVGQKVISLLDNHPLFCLAEVAASTRSEGKLYGDTVLWRDERPLPLEAKNLQIKSPLDVESKYVISALPTESALEFEPILAQRGQMVFSNASAFRMDQAVPLLIPEVNLEHLSLLEDQSTNGKIVTNPNCCVAVLAPALAPLQKLAKIEAMSVVTMQAVSGAGYPGVPSLDILGNIIPHIGGEEEKIQTEVKKILGSAKAPADFYTTVHVHRVPVLQGHTIVAHIRFQTSVSVEQALQAYHTWNERYPGLFEIHLQMDRPQPARDLTPYDSRVHLGRLKQGEDPHVLGLVAMGHNLVRGAAGAALGNLEAYLKYSSEHSNAYQ